MEGPSRLVNFRIHSGWSEEYVVRANRLDEETQHVQKGGVMKPREA